MSYFTSVKSNVYLVDFVLLFVRVFVGFAMLSHGYPKLQQLLSGEEIQFYNFMGIGEKASLFCAVFAEFVCSIFLILGLFSRIALFFLSFTMVVAGFVIHSSDPFNKREMSMLYLSIFLLLFAFGPGKYSVDAMISRKRNSEKW